LGLGVVGDWGVVVVLHCQKKKKKKEMEKVAVTLYTFSDESSFQEEMEKAFSL
jgi:hypothetical protein